MSIAVPCLVIAALFVGTGASLKTASHRHLRFPVLMAALFLLQGVARARLPFVDTESDWAVLVWGVAVVLLTALVVLNVRYSPAFGVVALGLSANLLVVLANGGMPVLLEDGQAWDYTGAFYHPMTRADVLWFLADTLPAGSYMLSIGDVFLLVGVSAVLLSAGSKADSQALVSSECWDGSIIGEATFATLRER